MIPLLVVNFAMSMAMLWLTYHRATVGAAHFYPSTIPIMVQAALAALLALVGLLSCRPRFLSLVLSSIVLALLGIPAIYALSGWPGGDDGGGFGWIFLVGGGSVVCFFVGIITLSLGLARRSSAPPSPQPSPEPPPQSVPQLAAVPSVSPQSRQSHIPMWPLWSILAVFLLCFVWLIAGPISWTTSRTESYPGGITIRIDDLHQLTPLPPWHWVDAGHGQTIFLKDRQLTESFRGIHPSPTGSFMVAASGGQDRPMRIYNTADGNFLELSVDETLDEFHGHYNVYPFRFLRWEDDASFLVEVTGCDWKDRSQPSYRQVWRVSAATAVRTCIQSTRSR